jgi:uncharacterized membrane protein SirB2
MHVPEREAISFIGRHFNRGRRRRGNSGGVQKRKSMYFVIKHVHVTCVVLSACGFLLRGYWMVSDSRWLKSLPARVMPHIIDSTLLISAIALAVMIRQYPFAAGWVTAKVIGLIAYVLLGTIALKRGKTKSVRVSAFVAAIAVYAWIVSVALTKNVGGYFTTGFI